MKALKLASTIATPYAVVGLSKMDGKLKIESGSVTLNEKALLEILNNLDNSICKIVSLLICSPFGIDSHYRFCIRFPDLNPSVVMFNP